MTRFGAVGDVAQLILITFCVVSHHALKYYFLFIAAPPEYEIPPPPLSTQTAMPHIRVSVRPPGGRPAGLT